MSQIALKAVEQERSKQAEKHTEKRATRTKERDDRQRQVGRTVYGVYQNAKPVGRDGHPYLTEKQVRGDHLKVDKQGNLLIPMTDVKGFQHSMQTIKPDGTKFYPKGARKIGLMHQVNPEVKPGKGSIVIAEGYATAASLANSTKHPVFAAFSSDNLRHVAKALRKQYPRSELVIAADNSLDAKNQRGQNLKAAAAVSRELGIPYVAPKFTDQDKQQGLKSWNDLAIKSGQKAMLKQLGSELQKARGIIQKRAKGRSEELAVA